MKRFILLLSLLLGLFVAATSAQEEFCTSDPNDDSLPECYTPEDNECYEGGTMENRCLNEWDWSAGWYFARYNQGLMSREELLAMFAFLLPIEILSGDSSGLIGGTLPVTPITPTSASWMSCSAPGVTPGSAMFAYSNLPADVTEIAITHPDITFELQSVTSPNGIMMVTYNGTGTLRDGVLFANPGGRLLALVGSAALC